MKKTIIRLSIFAFAALIPACQTIRELKALAKCDFRVKDIGTLDLNGMNLLKVESFTDLSLADGAKLFKAYNAGSLPLNITFNLEVRNNHDKLAALEQLDWILEVDKQNMVNGTSNQRFAVAPGGGMSVLPLSTALDLRKVLGKESLESVMKVIAGIKGQNEAETRIRLKIKPRFRIAGALLGYPGFIKVGKTFEESKVEKENK
jgi:hypothetical protein